MLESTMIKKTNDKITMLQTYLKDTFSLDMRLKSKLFLAGGAVMSMINNETPNDWDFYFDAKKEYVEKFRAKIKLAIEDHEKAKDIIITPSAITFKKLKIQVVLRYYGSPESIIDLFDFAHTEMYITKDKVVVSDRAWKSLATKKLFYTGSQYPLSALFRMRKFMKRRWDIDVGQITKIAIQISQFDFFRQPETDVIDVGDWEDHESLFSDNIFIVEEDRDEPFVDELAQAYSDTDIPPSFIVQLFGQDAFFDQLIGVDVVIFANVIEEMKNVGEFTEATVFEIIDAMFK